MTLNTKASFIGHNDCFGFPETQIKEALRELIHQGVTDFLNVMSITGVAEVAKLLRELNEKSHIINLGDYRE